MITTFLAACLLIAPEVRIQWRNLVASPPNLTKVRRECDQLVPNGWYPPSGSFVKPFESAMKAVMAKSEDDEALLRASLLLIYGSGDSAFVRSPERERGKTILQAIWGTRKNVRDYELARAYAFVRISIYGHDHFARTDVWHYLTKFAEDPWTVSARCNSRAWATNSKTDRAYRLSKRDYLLKVPFYRFRFLHTVQIANLVEGLEQKDKALMRTAIGQIRKLEQVAPPNHPEFPKTWARQQADGLEELIKKW
jgi:hypothetical protein